MIREHELSEKEKQMLQKMNECGITEKIVLHFIEKRKIIKIDEIRKEFEATLTQIELGEIIDNLVSHGKLKRLIIDIPDEDSQRIYCIPSVRFIV